MTIGHIHIYTQNIVLCERRRGLKILPCSSANDALLSSLLSLFGGMYGVWRLPTQNSATSEMMDLKPGQLPSREPQDSYTAAPEPRNSL